MRVDRNELKGKEKRRVKGDDGALRDSSEPSCRWIMEKRGAAQSICMLG